MVHSTDWVDRDATNPWRLDDGVKVAPVAPEVAAEVTPSKDAKKSSGYDLIFAIFCCGLIGLAIGTFIVGVMVPIKLIGKLFE